MVHPTRLAAIVLGACLVPAWAAPQPTDITAQVTTALRSLERDLEAAGQPGVHATLLAAPVNATLPEGVVSVQVRRPSGLVRPQSKVWVDVAVDGTLRKTVLVPVAFATSPQGASFQRGDTVTVVLRAGPIEVSQPAVLLDDWRTGQPARVRLAQTAQPAHARLENGVFVLMEESTR